MRVHIVTVSDRASRGDYKDKSGPQIRVWLEQYAAERDLALSITGEIVPDDARTLRTALLNVCDRQVDAIFTTGGTGVGPRDITPDIVTAIAEKTIPGIMEHIRLLHGRDNPLALLSQIGRAHV